MTITPVQRTGESPPLTAGEIAEAGPGTPLLAAALRYAAMGWHVFPVTVRWDEKLGKKRATFPESWAAASTTDTGKIAGWFGPGGLYEHGTVAIDCGKSGLVVVDVDGAEGAASWAQLCEDWSVPATYVAQTPSGGEHWYYRAGNEINDLLAGIDASGKLAPKVDVRGTGGLVFAPPSSDARGEYRWTEGEPSSTDSLTLVPRIVCTRVPTKTVREQKAATPAGAIDSPQGDPFAPPARAYTAEQAREIVGRELAAFRGMRTPEDTGFNDALNRLAVIYGHFVPAFVSEEDAVWRMYAAAEHNRSVEFQGSAGVRATIRSGLTAGMREPYACSDSSPPIGQSGEGEQSASAVDRLLARMIDSADLADIAYPEPLIRGVLDLASESWIIGAPGGFKSFIALDWACHVATGRAWRGQGVKPGRVVYVAAEGKKSVRQRREAWSKVYGAEPERGQVMFLPEPVQVSDAAGWATLVAACRQLEPVLIVLDTQARITVGIEENSNGAMSVLTDAVRRLKEATGACVLVVHHTGRNGEDARGASAIDGAQDTEIRVDRPKGRIGRDSLTATISTDKQKDGDESVSFEIQLQRVELGINPATGEPVTSLAITPHDPFAPAVARPLPDWIGNLTENQTEVMAAMRDHSDERGVTKTDLARWIKERRELTSRPAMARTSLDSALRDLVNKDLIRWCRGSRIVLAELLDEDDK